VTYPLKTTDRRRMRTEIRDRAMATAGAVGRSTRCGQWGQHATVHPTLGRIGCANDSSNCLCECHDPEEKPDA